MIQVLNDDLPTFNEGSGWDAILENTMRHWRRANMRRQFLILLVTVGLIGGAAPNPSAAKAPKPAKTTGLLMSRCSFSHRSPSDPIVHPGMSGMSHSHDFFGNTTTNADSTAESLLGQTTNCRIAGDTAAYWVPTLFANQIVVKPVASLAYYRSKQRSAISEMPFGLKIVAGGRDNVRWSCFDHGMANATHLKPAKCTDKQFGAVGIKFPQCWNGTDLDSADHRSHMAYAKDGACPTTHPQIVPQLTFWVLYEPISPGATLSLASGEVSTAHADFFNAFEPQAQQKLHDFCINGHRSCYKTMGKVLRKLKLPSNPPARSAR